MKFIVDAQLPRRLAVEINRWGDDAIHTLDLPTKNLTSDSAIIGVARLDSRVVVTKDSDFVDSLLLRAEPEKLLFITTGNITNDDLIALLEANWRTVLSMLQEGSFVELSRSRLTLHS